MTASMEELRSSLAQAADLQIARVVAIVDSMPHRGAADALIAPLRPRLAQLRPARPHRFTRMLFTPLDAVIVPAAEWRRTMVGLPRPALVCLGEAVRLRLPPHDPAAAGFWPASAAALDALRSLEGWERDTGLSADEFAAVRGNAAAVLHEADRIAGLEAGHDPADDRALRAMLARGRARGAAALDTLAAVLLARMPNPAAVLALAVAAGTERAAGQAIDRLAASLADDAGGCADAADAAREVARVAALIDALEAGAGSERLRQIEAVRRQADAFCRAVFDEVAARGLVASGVTMTAAAADQAVAGMEARARDLRRLESAGRRLGSGAHYDAALSAAATAVWSRPGALGLADRVRMVEILAGTDAALALLDGASAE